MTIFIIPQSAISTILKQQKRERLELISDQIEQLNESIENQDQIGMMVTFLRIQSLLLMFEQVEKLREFPYETSTLQKVITTSLIPIAIKIILPLFNI